jgi:hypothetical protein
MKFEDIAKESSNLDLGTNHMMVYHSGFLKSKHGTVFIRLSLYDFSSLEYPHNIIRPLYYETRRVITTKMKREGNRDTRCAYVKCLYPLLKGSPYYTDEELFMAELSGDYSEIYTNIRKEFMEWKRNN